ncbi:hypothetical protein QY97_00937 [Bacillus thermotolerans]|uniref:Uncharacterized protein n=1 Tax=Bacillus thermotolerans TaxID=1221996 RepID=A0A0F5I6S5_BACTR|nr:hypothetical protein QY97_00937 [Bacillus thermotolerans]KKB40995.1 hypothetical protein QY95_01058 [Bacillus thermotolerans]KKB44939.1 hypothetical protein QY96_00063 [Bacillus thermotolerans]
MSFFHRKNPPFAVLSPLNCSPLKIWATLGEYASFPADAKKGRKQKKLS